MMFRHMLRPRRPICHKPDSTHNQPNPGQPIRRKMLVQPEMAEQRNDNITKGSRRHHEGEVGPRKCGHVAGEESDEEKDSGGDKWIEEGVPEETEMMKIDGANLGHATGEQRVANRCSEHNSDENGVLGGF